MLQTILIILLSIVAFGVLIAVHEGGHFLAAKACGVKVNEFSLGMGPKLLQKQGRETLYSLRAFPIGGFCAMEGEDEETGDPRAFAAKSAWRRVVILLAGPLMNFLLGFVLVLCIVGSANLREPVVASFVPGCPYEGEDGLLVGDKILSVDGHRTFFSNNFSEYMRRSGGDRHDIVLIRDGARVTLENYSMPPLEFTTESGAHRGYGFYFAPREFGVGANLRYAWYESLVFVRLVWESLGDLVSGAVGVRELTGIVGVVDYVTQVTSEAEDVSRASFDFIFFFSLIAVNLAVMNLLPIPALDGGRIFFLFVTWVIEHVSRRKLNPKYEAYVHGAGLILLMGLMVFVLFNDVFRIVTR